MDLVLTIERPVAGGRMLARHDGQIVFVAGTIPGERVRVALDRVTKNSAWAHVVEIIEPSPDRRELWCDPSCGGLSYAHIAYDRQRALKGEVVADAFRRLSNIDLGTPPAVAASPEHDYRLRSRLHIRGGRAGFFREGTHVLCDAAPTGQLSDACIAAIEATMARLGSRTAECDAVVIAENVAATERVLHLEPREGARLDDLAGAMKLASSTTGLTTIVRGRTVALAGNPTVTDSAATLLGPESPIGGLAVWTRKASSFFQGNRFLTGALVRRVLDLASGDSVADLYAGVGLFAVALAARGSRVIAVEGDQSSGSDLEANAAPWKEQLRVIRRAVEDVVMRPPPEPFDALVIDPPRSGVSAAAIAGMLSWKPPLIVYVSCDPPTLARDAARIVQAGYQLRSVDALDFFPNTPHVETVARFTSGPVPDSPSDRALA